MLTLVLLFWFVLWRKKYTGMKVEDEEDSNYDDTLDDNEFKSKRVKEVSL